MSQELSLRHPAGEPKVGAQVVQTRRSKRGKATVLRKSHVTGS